MSAWTLFSFSFDFIAVFFQLECCGVESFVDSLEIHRGIPYVCCVNVTEGCNVPDGELWKSGCVGAIVDVTSNAAKALGGAAIAAFLVEVRNPKNL